LINSFVVTVKLQARIFSYLHFRLYIIFFLSFFIIRIIQTQSSIIPFPSPISCLLLISQHSPLLPPLFRERRSKSLQQPLHLLHPHSGTNTQLLYIRPRQIPKRPKLTHQLHRIRLIHAPNTPQNVRHLIDVIGMLPLLNGRRILPIELLESLEIPRRLLLAPRQNERQIILHAQIIQKQQNGGIVLHVHETEQHPQFEIRFEFGDAAVDVVGVEVVVAEGEEEGAAGGGEDVIGGHGGVLVGDVADVGEEGVAALAGGDVEDVGLEGAVVVARVDCRGCCCCCRCCIRGVSSSSGCQFFVKGALLGQLVVCVVGIGMSEVSKCLAKRRCRADGWRLVWWSPVLIRSVVGLRLGLEFVSHIMSTTASWSFDRRSRQRGRRRTRRNRWPLLRVGVGDFSCGYGGIVGGRGGFLIGSDIITSVTTA